ncbi:hypothetical protein ISF_08915 [Cordyceps fumosorosea ARSEF 2679]|uniref:Uncharacterized protein n=1 Tax=Cordyceps fumosorosea (strain ARSEF 2679) TaxID=1081104 RepID=A0A167LNJ5_CORFA|nr:hypothetical protein ISF_08915 [Cordyceps fumosorosea ARSEF 2679]OAA53301.1 hypothetical protein ISF_08915 [Cordyceps fumosorosea ARSEF 2679]
MDQGSYSRPDGRGHPTLSASSAANNNYQVNVSRQKTKKWVEAKSQNYDGDDWGADEFDDEEPEPQLPLSPRGGPHYGVAQGASDVPSLHIQTNPPSQLPQQHQPYPPPQSRPPPPANTQTQHESNNPLQVHPSSSAPQSSAPQSAGGFQPQSASSTYPLSPRSPPDSLPSTTPQAASTSKPLPFVRPSDIYRRMEEEKSRGSSESSRPSAEIASNVSKQSSVSPARTAAEPVKPQPPAALLPAPRTDSYNSVYQDLTKPRASHAPQQPAVTSPPRAGAPAPPFATPDANSSLDTVKEETKRLSTSPKLPDLARMSVFGADFFSSGFSSLSSEQISEQKIPEVPKVAPELKVDNPAAHQPNPSLADAPKASVEKTLSASALPVVMEDASIKHEDVETTVNQPPSSATTAPESREPAMPTESKLSDSSKQAATRSSIDTTRSVPSASDITPTKPLNVRKEDSPVRSFEPPPALQREPTFGTDTSSPVKESDMLRDEIIKTLSSPTQPSREAAEAGAADGGRKGSQGRTRDSTYTLTDYDSYWADADTAPTAPPPPPKTISIVPDEAIETTAVASRGPASATTESSEEKPKVTPPASHEGVAAQAAHQVSTGAASAAPAVVSPIPQSASPQRPAEASIVSPVSTDLRRRFSWEAEYASKPSPTAVDASAATAAPPPGPAPSDPKPQPEPVPAQDREPGSSPANVATLPAVAATDSASPVSKRLSLADEKALSTTTSNEVSAPVDEHPALRLSEPAPAPALSMPRTSSATVTPFKDIMGLSNSSDRVAKFNETRVTFAVMDVGLDRWLTSLHQDHPEYHSKSFNSYQPSSTSPTGAPQGAYPPAQQPYYQQYLNASTPSSGPSPGRRIGGIPVPSNVGGSTFGHSGNQIGTKSKELMHSAGKMGKGLFSKGKNKLRGDKGDAHPPQQTKAKHERSGSWAVLSSKLRTELSSSKEHEHPHQHSQQFHDEYSAAPRPSMTIAPQIPVPEPVSPLLREASPDKSLPPTQTSAQPAIPGSHSSSISAASPLASSIPPSSQIRIVPSETAHDHGNLRSPIQAPPVAEDSGVGMLAQPDESGDAPKRQSSFVGLPPIRRSSTFGLKSKARRAAERFPLDEEDGNGVPDLPTDDVLEHPPSQSDIPRQPHGEHTGAPHVGSTSQIYHKEGATTQHQPVTAEHSHQTPARQPTTAPPQPQPIRPLVHPPLMMYPGQSGPWRLEESHLAEPLHQAKNRSCHSPISPSMNYDFDKETEHSAMMPPPPLPSGNARSRNTDVPPSSAQRYPGLFAPRPDEEPLQRPISQVYYEEKVNPRHSGNEYSIPGVGPPTEERGRAKRNSGMFKEIGDKIARATSRDRRNSFVESRPPADSRADGASESSVGTEEIQDRRKRRSSFFNALTGRASMDPGPQHDLSALERSQTESLPLSSTGDLGSARKRSMLASVVTGFGGNKTSTPNAATSGLASPVGDDEPPSTPKKKRFSGIAKAFQRPNQERPSSGMSNASEHSRRASFSNLLSTLTGSKSQLSEQSHAVAAPSVGGVPSNDLPQNVPPAPHQIHPADGFPAAKRDSVSAPSPHDQRLDQMKPLFTADENKWGIERPPTSTTVTANEAKADTGQSPTSTNLPLRSVDPSAQSHNPTAPSEISDSETDVTENARKPSDVTPSVTSGGDVESADANVSQITPTIVTDVPRQGEQQQTPTAQYPNSPGGYFIHNRMQSSAPLSAGSQGYPQGQLMQPQQDPHRSLAPAGGEYGQGMSRPAPGPQYSQYVQQPTPQLNHYQQQPQQYTQPVFDQPASRAEQGSASPKGWKGLKTRMAGQMASMSQSSPNSKNQSKGDSPTSDKLRGAFKRLSKQQGTPDTQQQGGEQAPGSRGFAGRAGQQPHQQMQPQHRQPQYMQPQHMPPRQMTMGQRPYQEPYSQQGASQQQTSMNAPQQSHLNHQQHSYAAVPIPQGYTTIRGQGYAQVPTAYASTRQHPQYQSPNAQQQSFAGHDQTSPIAGSYQQSNGHASGPGQPQSAVTEPQPRAPVSQQPFANTSDALSPISTTQHSGSMTFSPSSDELRSPRVALTEEALAQQNARKDLQAPHLRPDENQTGLGPSNSNRVSQVSVDSRRHGPSPKSEPSPVASYKQLQTGRTSSASPVRERLVSAASISPPAGSGSDVVSPIMTATRAETSTPAAAPLVRDLTGDSRGQVSDDSLEKKGKLDKTIATTVRPATEHVVELEDTAEARQRTLRLDAQEEKIAYDPEEENPKMAATSYPGQEWNPYGEPGFSEWHE